MRKIFRPEGEASAWVLGRGGHAAVLAEAWQAAGGMISGFVVPAPQEEFAETGQPIREEAKFMEAFAGRTDVLLLLGIGSVRADERRLSLATRYMELGFQFPPVLHPTAFISPSASFGPGAVVLSGAVVSTQARIGQFAIINHAAVVDHHCIVEEGAHIAPGAILGGGVRIGRGTLVGAGAVVRQGIVIESGCTVGAGAVVVRNAGKNEILVGCPAVVRRTR